MEERQDLKILQDGQSFNLQNETLEIIHLPGHTPGSIGVLHREKKLLCSGDMLFHGFPMLDNIFGQSSQPDFETSMEKILQLTNNQKVKLLTKFCKIAHVSFILGGICVTRAWNDL